MVVGGGFVGVGHAELLEVFGAHMAGTDDLARGVFDAFDRAAQGAEKFGAVIELVAPRGRYGPTLGALDPKPKPNAHGWYRMHAPKLRAPKHV